MLMAGVGSVSSADRLVPWVGDAMRLCPTCERPRTEGSKTCTGCGREFGSGLANIPEIIRFGERVPGRTRFPLPLRRAAFAAAAIVLVAGAAGAAWLFSHHGARSPVPPASAAGPPGHAVQPTAPATSGPGAPSSLAPSALSAPSVSPTGSDQGLVTVTDSAAQDSAAPSVAAFADSYFAAINAHHYLAYRMLLGPELQQNMTRASFNEGYNGTVDSAIQLVSISAAADGDTEAVLTFTSHQVPDSADGQESCTNWDITLFLTPASGAYLIDQSPPGYQASSSPC